MDENALREAFAKVKIDIFSLGNELYTLRSEILDIKNEISAINDAINSMKINILELQAIKNEPKSSIIYPKYPTHTPTHNPTDEPKYPTIPAIPTDNPTDALEARGLKAPNLGISSGNRGVPTDRQTNQQTDNYSEFLPLDSPQNTPKSLKPLKTSIQDASEILDGLDTIKKEIRLKFKQMTSQEMAVFSAIYQLEEISPEGIEYRQIAQKLHLSESSIRDYAQKLINKGIPVDKIKLNNKKILLRISPELKKITSLQAIIQLREL